MPCSRTGEDLLRCGFLLSIMWTLVTIANALHVAFIALSSVHGRTERFDGEVCKVRRILASDATNSRSYPST